MARTKILNTSAQARPLQRFRLSEKLPNTLLLPGLLFCLALAIRMWGLSFGLPYFFSVDEINKREAAMRLAETHFTHRNSQPSFLYNSLYLVFSLARLVNPQWTTVQYHYMGRLWMALLGALTVVVLYHLGSLWDRRIGLLAALFLAILPLHTATSRYIKEDTPLTLMATITMLLVVLYLRHPSRPAASAAAFFAGISFSTKYSGLPLVLPVALAIAVSALRTRREARAIVLDVFVTILAFLVGFFVVSPTYLWHPHSFVSGFLGQWEYSNRGHHDGIITDPWGNFWIYYIRTGLIPGMTWPLFLLSVAGLVLMPKAREGWLVTVTVVWLYLIFEHGRAKPYPFSARYLLPIVPLLCLSAAGALVRIAVLLKPKLPSPAVIGICAALFVLPPLAKSLLIADEALHDTRTIAGAWMEQAIPPGSNIVVTELSAYLPVSQHWGKEWRVLNLDQFLEMPPGWHDQQAIYFVVSSFTYQRYFDHPEAVPWRTRFYYVIMDKYQLVREFAPRWLTYGFHSPVIRIYQPPTLTKKLSFDSRGITGCET